MCAWNPEDDRPNFHRLAYRLDARWAATEPTPCRVWWATPLAVAEFGGVGGRVRQALQVEHDLAVTEVFLRRGRGADWRLEDVFAAGEFGAKVPDAVVADGTGGTTVIEIGGQYSAARLDGFHHAMARLDLPYELW